MVYLLSKMHELSIEEGDAYAKMILKNKSDEGAFYTDNSIKSVWSTSQACLALIEIGMDEKFYMDSVEWICSVQKDSGGWSYNGSYSEESIIHTFYTVLLLLRLQGIEYIDYAIKRTMPYLCSIVQENTEDVVSKLIAVYLRDLINDRFNNEKTNPDEIKSILSFMMESASHGTIADICFSDLDSIAGITYEIDYYIPASYLMLRRYILPDHPLAQFYIRFLIENRKNGRSWASNIQGRSPMCWCTALSAYTIYAWKKDCERAGIEIKLQGRKTILKSLRLEMCRMSERVFICPLNNGDCGKKVEIEVGYSSKNIFVDIPYDDTYKHFRKEIERVLITRGYNPIIVDNNINSSVVLCNVCRSIQECKYGVADVSGSRPNVYLELGMMFGLNKHCAILKKWGENLSSDIQGKTFLEYKNTDELADALNKWLDSVEKD